MRELIERFGRRARPAEPMSGHTTFRIGGPAELLIDVETHEELRNLLVLAHERGKPLTVIGRGANVLVRDEGIPGIVVRLAGVFREVAFDNASEMVRVGAGTSLGRLVAQTVERGWNTFAWAAGIPGTVGGALLMNAGSWGESFGTFVGSVEVTDRAGGRHVLEEKDLSFGYRETTLPVKDAIVTGVTLQLIALEAAGEADPGRMKDEYIARKLRTQPLKEPSAGCVFRNPPGQSAGALIDEAGCRGLRVGGAEVSTRHANYLVNAGGATATDVLALLEKVRERVREHAGVTLELELRVIP
jgi:UDP-N-acetylmuramate dehydrogenase